MPPRPRYASDSEGPNKAQKTNTPRPRRAARACEKCRASKLRCVAAGDRCAHCIKMDLECVYTDPPPASAVPGDERLLRLEANVGKLLEIMQKGGEGQPPQPSPAAARQESPIVHHATLETLSQLAGDGIMGSWISPPAPRHTISPVGPNFFDTLVSAATEISPLACAELSPLGEPSISSNTTKTPTSGHEHDYPTHARPIPRAGAGSRMAAFTDPSSHEAPFRPLTYNPDTFRNTEIDGEPLGAGTPKRGRGDPIDRGIFSEAEARRLFDFFVKHIAFFMPVFQEPMTFDAVRHRSSFLLSTILAIAAKYNCVSTGTADMSVDEDKWFEIRALALSSYFQALISKVHCLGAWFSGVLTEEDVQAMLLQCAWGLQDRGASTDPWMMTGSAYRLARRLGIHLVAGALRAGTPPTARLVASLKTYLCLYAFDRFFTVGFGRPETEGFEQGTLDASLLITLIDSDETALFCSPESAVCVTAYVELATIAKHYSRFVNVLLKESPGSFQVEMRDLDGQLDVFSRRWLWLLSPLAAKLGPASLPIKMLYNHIRLCVHAVPLKPVSHPASDLFLQRTGLQGPSGAETLSTCLRKAQDSAIGIIQAFADDAYNTILCLGYDYAFMLLAHAAAILLSMTTISVCGVSAQPSRGGVDGVAAKRYCEMAIAAMVESNRSANFFPCDMACNLSLIAQEMGIAVVEWMSDGRCSVGRSENCACSHRSQGGDATDLSFMFDIDQFLQPGFLDSGSLFSSALLT
ncbi:hypothetical protein CspeluHIS016_0106400 [Cutaneotrichosporon spelunceum]|uniref:Zn(2)-C6 fungal-type domain-containing protein n=1 Tax=Cutaneotrichosporon spelunceum TaxID=1672016 RepID=A0AAD3Y9U9_9TREE|nr:hypothetical protein CspeluHIS016_0106400 [Cutaneotrichosporon spelunceum]